MKTGFLIILNLFLLLAGESTFAQTPRLNSLPGAGATIFLNFDGEYVTGTPWNWNGPINAQPAGLSAEAVVEIFNRVAEDYRPFNINITTDPAVYAAAPFNRRAHVISTPTSGWYGSAGGVAFIGSFNWGDDTPAWVFSALLFNNPKNVAEACSHEAGHTLGLQHQSAYSASCAKTAEYNAGQGSGEIGWAPIMGVGYSKNLTTWHTGSSTLGCDVIQNDMDLIAGAVNNIGYRADDHGDDRATADSISLLGEQFQVNGLINRMADVDMFKFLLPRNSRLRLTAVPQNVGSGNQGANIDLKVVLLNPAGDTLGSYNPSALLDAGVDTSLPTGLYYIAVRGIGNINHSEYGSLGAYSLTGSLISLLPVQQFVLTGRADNEGHHLFSWTIKSDESIYTVDIEGSEDAIRFRALATIRDRSNSFSYQPVTPAMYYRLKATGAQGVYYSNTIRLAGDRQQTAVRLLSGVVKDEVVFTSNTRCAYEVYDVQGKLFGKGWTVIGTNRVNLQQAPAGVLFLRVGDGTHFQVEKLIRQ